MAFRNQRTSELTKCDDPEEMDEEKTSLMKEIYPNVEE